MEFMDELEAAFEVTADFLGNGNKQELYVIPTRGTYEVIFDGVPLVTVRHLAGPPEQWEQIEGNMDQQAIDNIGEAIESYYM